MSQNDPRSYQLRRPSTTLTFGARGCVVVRKNIFRLRYPRRLRLPTQKACFRQRCINSHCAPDSQHLVSLTMAAVTSRVALARLCRKSSLWFRQGPNGQIAHRAPNLRTRARPMAREGVTLLQSPLGSAESSGSPARPSQAWSGPGALRPA